MSIAYELDRSTGSDPRVMGRAAPLRGADLLLAPAGIVLLLAGPELLFWPGFGLVLLAWLIRGRGAAGWLSHPTPLDVGWLALLIGSLVGLLVSHNATAATSRMAAVVAALTAFYWLRDQAQSSERFRAASWGLVIVCALGALVVLGLIRGQLPESLLTRRLAPLLAAFSVFPGVSGDVLEVNSRFPVHQYGLAYLLLVITPFLAAAAVFGQRRTPRVLAGLGALALTTLLAATETRGALLALAVAVAAVGALRSRWAWLLLPLGAGALYLLLARGIISRSIETAWLETRLSIWSRSLDLLTDYPLTGAGLGMRTFAELFAWNFGLPDPYRVVHSHNVFIQAYAEQGLIGLVALALLLIGGALYAWQGARRVPAESRIAAAGVFGALLGSLLYGLTDQVPTTNFGLVILAGLGALAMAAAAAGETAPIVDRRDAPPRSARRRSLVLQAGLLVALGVLLVGVTPRWISGLTHNLGAAQLGWVALNRGLSAEQRAGGLDRSDALLATSIDWNPLNAAAYREQARVRLLRNDVPGTLAALGAARQTGNLNTYERTQLGRLYFTIGFWQDAVDLWREARQVEQLTQAAGELAGKGEHRAATAAHAALSELQPEVDEHYANLAKAMLAGPRPSVEEAMTWFERAALLNPEARRSISRQLVLDAEDFRTNERRCAGRFDQAVFWFGLASRVDPTFDKPEVELGAVHYYAAHCAAMAGRTAEADRLFDASAGHFRAATARDPKNSSSWHQLGQTEAARGQLTAALSAFEQAVALAPNRANLRLSLGQSYSLAGQCEAARRELSEAVRLDASSQVARTELERLSACR